MSDPIKVENLQPQTLREQMGVPKMEIRYLLYSDSRGVHLGGNVWSKDEEAKTKTSAPTYSAGMAIPPDVTDARLVEAWPDLPGQHCSKTKVADACLPVW
jgi:hypothetical protein